MTAECQSIRDSRVPAVSVTAECLSVCDSEGNSVVRDSRVGACGEENLCAVNKEIILPFLTCKVSRDSVCRDNNSTDKLRKFKISLYI